MLARPPGMLAYNHTPMHLPSAGAEAMRRDVMQRHHTYNMCGCSSNSICRTPGHHGQQLQGRMTMATHQQQQTFCMPSFEQQQHQQPMYHQSSISPQPSPQRQGIASRVPNFTDPFLTSLALLLNDASTQSSSSSTSLRCFPFSTSPVHSSSADSPDGESPFSFMQQSSPVSGAANTEDTCFGLFPSPAPSFPSSPVAMSSHNATSVSASGNSFRDDNSCWYGPDTTTSKKSSNTFNFNSNSNLKPAHLTVPSQSFRGGVRANAVASNTHNNVNMNMNSIPTATPVMATPYVPSQHQLPQHITPTLASIVEPAVAMQVRVNMNGNGVNNTGIANNMSHNMSSSIVKQEQPVHDNDEEADDDNDDSASSSSSSSSSSESESDSESEHEEEQQQEQEEQPKEEPHRQQEQQPQARAPSPRSSPVSPSPTYQPSPVSSPSSSSSAAQSPISSYSTEEDISLPDGPCAAANAPSSPMASSAASTASRSRKRKQPFSGRGSKGKGRKKSTTSPGLGAQQNGGTPVLGLSCHQCKIRKTDTELVQCCNSFKLKTTGRERACLKKYCLDCIRKSGYAYTAGQTSMWLCPSCEGTCQCVVCRRRQ